ncbi:MAG: DoxX family protein [Mycobacteriaceae bacterium]|nr:DoxX family protein [Mycobacteriaceae bacterium]
MNVGYWIIGGLLAAFYLYSGGIKVVRTQEQLQPMMGWAGTLVPMRGVRLIGALEVSGAIGLILPPLTGIASGLAVVAAVGLAVVQVGALYVHGSRGEWKQTPLNVALLAMAAAAAWLGTAFL